MLLTIFLGIFAIASFSEMLHNYYFVLRFILKLLSALEGGVYMSNPHRRPL